MCVLPLPAFGLESATNWGRIKVSSPEGDLLSMSSQTQVTEASAPDLNQILSGPKVHRNLQAATLTEYAISRGEARLASNGALVAETGKRTGRSPKDKFTVKDARTAERVLWGDVNQPFGPEKFDALYRRALTYLKDRELFVQDLFAGADPKYRLPVRIVNELAWHNLFVRQLFVRPSPQELSNHRPEFTVIGIPNLLGEPQRDGTKSEVFILTDFNRGLILIGGTH